MTDEERFEYKLRIAKCTIESMVDILYDIEHKVSNYTKVLNDLTTIELLLDEIELK